MAVKNTEVKLIKSVITVELIQIHCDTVEINKKQWKLEVYAMRVDRETK